MCNTLPAGDALAREMRRLLRAHHDDRLALDEATAEGLLTGRLAPADLPVAYARVAELLAAAAAPPSAEELAGEAAAVARFAAAAHSRPVRLLHLNPRRSRVLTKLLTVKAAAVALGMLAAGGVAAAATGTLPAPAQQVAHTVLGRAGVPAAGASTTTASSASTATTPTTTAAGAHAGGPDAAGPAAQGLCRAWAAGQGGQQGKKLDAVAFAALARAAGGSGKVAAYCATATSASGTAPSSSAAPSTTRGSGRGGPPSSVPPSSVPASTVPPTTIGHGGPPSTAPASTVPSSTGGP
jgi:hypothetical protein